MTMYHLIVVYLNFNIEFFLRIIIKIQSIKTNCCIRILGLLCLTWVEVEVRFYYRQRSVIVRFNY